MTGAEAALIMLLLDSQDAPEATAPPPPVEYVDTSEPFPSVRDVSYDPNDIGSAGKDGTGNTRYIAVRKGGITVLGMTMGDIVDGRINFGVTANQIIGADLRLWISAQPDSIRVSEACSYVGYAEASLELSSQLCQLSPGGRYYINIAACSSGFNDYNCTDSAAMTAADDGRIVIEAQYRRQQ